MKIITPKRTTLFILLSLFVHSAYAQETDSAKYDRHIAGAVTVTNNGISLLPTFTLGKPAAIFDFRTGHRTGHGIHFYWDLFFHGVLSLQRDTLFLPGLACLFPCQPVSLWWFFPGCWPLQSQVCEEL